MTSDHAMLTPSSQEAPTAHAPGLINPRWPLCLEADARDRGWTMAEIEDGEIAWLPDQFGNDWPVAQDTRPQVLDLVVGCHECLMLVHS